jgi:hypothetical protein
LEGIAGSVALTSRARDPLMDSKLREVKLKTRVANKVLGRL